jgi:hypothetical protein
MQKWNPDQKTLEKWMRKVATDGYAKAEKELKVPHSILFDHIHLEKNRPRFAELKTQVLEKRAALKKPVAAENLPGSVHESPKAIGVEVVNDADLETRKPSESPKTKELDTTERLRFEQCEIIIEKGWATFVEVGEALWEIKKLDLYREHFDRFEDYCKARWGCTATHANRQIAAAKVAKLLPRGSVAKLCESQLRPLVGLPEESIPGVWEKVRALAEDTPITAEIVQKVVSEAGGSKPLSRRRKSGSKSLAKQIEAAIRMLTTAEAALKGGDMKAVAAALVKLRGILVKD